MGVDIGRKGSAGTLSIVDSNSSCGTGVSTDVSGNGQGSLVLDNFQQSGGAAVKSATGDVIYQNSVPAGQTWVMGNE